MKKKKTVLKYNFSLKKSFPFPPLVAGLVTLQLFQNCFPRISVVYPVCFLVNKNSFGTNITCNLTRHCGLPLLLAKKNLSPHLELNFLFFSDTSLLTLIGC